MARDDKPKARSRPQGGLLHAPLPAAFLEHAVEKLQRVFGLVVLVVRWMGGTAGGGGIHGPTTTSPVDILKERYARGEIDTKEFEERRKALGE